MSRTQTPDIDGRPKLCLFATKDIGVGEELSYPYGDDKNLWWKNKACSVYFKTILKCIIFLWFIIKNFN